MRRAAVRATPLLAALALASLAAALGAPAVLAVALGAVIALALWRPPPSPAPSRTEPAPLAAAGPGLDLGQVTRAPARSSRLVAGRRFWLALDELDRHVTVIGATGSGKTTTLARFIDAALAAERPVLVLDAKGGRLAQVSRALGQRHDQPARIWLPGDPDSWTYDLCAGEPTAVANRLVGAFEHGQDGQVYRNLAQALVPLVATALRQSGHPCDLDTLRFSLDQPHLVGLARRVPQVELKAELLSVDDNLSKQALSGLVGRLRALRFGAFGPWLLPSDRTLDPVASLDQPGLAYFGLPATAASEDVALVGRVLLQHLKQASYAGLWASQPRPGLIVLDEFASLRDAWQVIDLLLQAREARLAVVVSTQQLPDHRSLRHALLGAGALVIHQVGPPADARALAEALGAETGAEIVRSIQLGVDGSVGRRLLRRRDAFLVSPDELTHLPVGQAVVSIRFAEQRLALVQVEPLRL